MKKTICILIVLCSMFFVGCKKDEDVTTTNSTTVLTTEEKSTYYTVTFDFNGGTLVSGEAVQSVKKGESAIPPVCSKDGYLFDCYDEDISEINSNMTVKATWVKSVMYKYMLDGENLTITGIDDSVDKSKITKIIVPEKYNGYKVTKIDSYAFYDCLNLTSIVIPKTIERIEGNAFYGCIYLTEIYNYSDLEMTKGATNHGQIALHAIAIHTEAKQSIITREGDYVYAYYDEKGYLISYQGTEINVEVPSSFIYDGEEIKKFEINDYAFFSCQIRKVVLPNSIIAIGERAFQGCEELLSINLPSSLKAIDHLAFSGCDRLVEIWNYSTLVIEKESGTNGQVGMFALAIHSLPNEESILCENGDYLFAYSDELGYLITYYGTEEELVLPRSFEYKDETIETYDIFYRCFSKTSIQEVTIPSNVGKIGKYAFFQCETLLDVIIENGVEVIEENAFCYCTAIESIVIESSIEEIGENAFNSIDILSTVYIKSEDVARNLDFIESEGCLVMSAETIYIERSITDIGDYVNVNYDCAFESETIDEVEYSKYTRKTF